MSVLLLGVIGMAPNLRRGIQHVVRVRANPMKTIQPSGVLIRDGRYFMWNRGCKTFNKSR